jgi:hypothetical protein
LRQIRQKKLARPDRKMGDRKIKSFRTEKWEKEKEELPGPVFIFLSPIFLSGLLS